jgi:hypothetical protein
MKMTRLTRLFILPAALLAVFFCSCSGRVDGLVRQDGDTAGAELVLEMSLQPRLTALIRSLSRSLGNAAPDKPVIDGPAIARSLAAAPGVSLAVLENTGPAAVRGNLHIANLDKFLAVPETLPGTPSVPPGMLLGESSAITPLLKYDPAGSLLIHLDRETGPRILALFSEEVNAYLSALLAPVATGESLTRVEYLSLVAVLYGKPLADEIAAATAVINLEMPRNISFIRGGSAQGRHARFDIPLPDLLVLEQPLDYEISWK